MEHNYTNISAFSYKNFILETKNESSFTVLSTYLNGTDLKIVTNEDLEDTTTLDNYVSNHNPIELKHRLEAFVRGDLERSITEVDYTSVRELTQHLQRKEHFVKGHLVKVEYFEIYDQLTDTGTNLLINVDMVYVYNTLGFVDKRTTTRTWILEDGSNGEITVSNKNYTQLEALREGISRRGNIIDQMKLTVPGLLMQFEGMTLPQAQLAGGMLFLSMEKFFNAYIGVHSMQIITELNTVSRVDFPWMDTIVSSPVTINHYINNELVY